MTGRIGSIFVVASSFGELLGPVIISLLFKGVGPWSFMYVMFGASCLVALLLTAMQIVAYQHGERYVKKKTEEPQELCEDGIPPEEKPMVDAEPDGKSIDPNSIPMLASHDGLDGTIDNSQKHTDDQCIDC